MVGLVSYNLITHQTQDKNGTFLRNVEVDVSCIYHACIMYDVRVSVTHNLEGEIWL